MGAIFDRFAQARQSELLADRRFGFVQINAGARTPSPHRGRGPTWITTAVSSESSRGEGERSHYERCLRAPPPHPGLATLARPSPSEGRGQRPFANPWPLTPVLPVRPYPDCIASIS